jgi:hypothetical protein
MSEPANVLAVDDIALLTHLDVRPAVASVEDINALIMRMNRFEDAVAEAVNESEAGAPYEEVIDLRDTADDAPVIKLVHSIIAQGTERGASDRRSATPYVARQVAVKTKYKRWVTQAQKGTIGRLLATCPGQEFPEPGASIPVTVTRALPAPTATSSHSTTTSGSEPGAGRVYANCAAARAAGVTPILRRTPDCAANPHLDRDHDGVACES